MLLEDLFSIASVGHEAGNIVAEVHMDADHPIFQGHFPGFPVTPGVIQLHLVKAVLTNQLKRDIKLKLVRTCKFLDVLDPGKTPFITINIKYQELETLEVVASGSASGTTFFKLQATYV
jgi:3-hydroxyacyl-[acyl-carrier-protein] dehydratase